MPTRLGNTLRRAEDHAGDRFGLDAVTYASHLLAVASGDTVAEYEDARLELDVTVRLVYIWLICTAAAVLVFLNNGWWLALSLVTFGLARLSYQAAIIAAGGFGDVLSRLVDLHRFDLLERLRWELPPTVGVEAEVTDPLWALLNGEPLSEADENISFRHRPAFKPEALE